MWLNGTELALRVRGLVFESCWLHFLFFYFIILLGTQTVRAVARVCQHQLSFLLLCYYIVSECLNPACGFGYYMQ